MIDIIILTEEINTEFTLSSLVNNSENYLQSGNILAANINLHQDVVDKLSQDLT